MAFRKRGKHINNAIDQNINNLIDNIFAVVNSRFIIVHLFVKFTINSIKLTAYSPVHSIYCYLSDKLL